jgi:MFS family permease
VLGLALFVGQAFLYNAVTFTQADTLTKLFGASSATVGVFIVPFALGNFLGPVILGRLFDVVGRRVMITLSYLGSAILLGITAWLLASGSLNAWTLTACESVTFFLASAGASAAYLTVSEIFPLEMRALAIAFFYAVGTGLGGIIGPALFGSLVGSGKTGPVAVGFVIGAAVMGVAGLVEAFIGVEAAQKSLESIAAPLSAADDADAGDGESGAGESERSAGAGATGAVGARGASGASGAVGASGAADGRRGETSGRQREYLRGGGRGWSRVPTTIGYPSAETMTGVRSSEVERLVAVLEQEGPMEPRALAGRVRAASWGPGRFRAALRQARLSGRIQRVDGRRLGAVSK